MNARSGIHKTDKHWAYPTETSSSFGDIHFPSTRDGMRHNTTYKDFTLIQISSQFHTTHALIFKPFLIIIIIPFILLLTIIYSHF